MAEGDLRPDIASLSAFDRAAIEARERWLKRAYDPERTRKAGGIAGKQIPPRGDYTQLLWKSGRGFGKTEALVQWAFWESCRPDRPGIIMHAVAPTLNDCRGTLFLGPAGFAPTIPPECLYGAQWERAYDSTHLELHLANGGLIRGFGAQDAGGRLRGPQAHALVGDELREWDRPAGNLKEVHTNAMFGLRLKMPDGSPSRACFATTPRPIPYLLNLYKNPSVLVVNGSSYENEHNLSDAFKQTVFSYEGTQLGKAEIYGQDLDDEAGGIFKRNWFRLWPANKKLPEFSFVLMSLDTAFGEQNYDAKRQETDYSACGVFGVFNVAQCFSEKERAHLGVKSRYAALMCDFWMERLGFPELLEKTRETYRLKYGYPGRRSDVVLIENKGSGISLRQTLMTYAVPTWIYNPGRESKTMRAHAASPVVMQGGIFIPESMRPDRKGMVRDWAEPMLEQVCAFQGSGSVEHDDAVDMLDQAVLYMKDRDLLTIAPMRAPKPDPDEIEEQRVREAYLARDRRRRDTAESPYGS